MASISVEVARFQLRGLFQLADEKIGDEGPKGLQARIFFDEETSQFRMSEAENKSSLFSSSDPLQEGFHRFRRSDGGGSGSRSGRVLRWG